MARMTVRLPDSLHDTLSRRAKSEGVSVNQYVVYALAQAAAVDSVIDQRRVFEEIKSRLPLDESEQALRTLLAERD